MQLSELVSGPGDLLLVALAVGVVGVVFYLVANLITRAMGMDMEEFAHKGRPDRHMAWAEGLTTFVSDARSIPLLLGSGGLFLIFGAILSALGAGVWFVIRAVSG